MKRRFLKKLRIVSTLVYHVAVAHTQTQQTTHNLRVVCLWCAVCCCLVLNWACRKARRVRWSDDCQLPFGPLYLVLLLLSSLNLLITRVCTSHSLQYIPSIVLATPNGRVAKLPPSEIPFCVPPSFIYRPARWAKKPPTKIC